MALTNSEINRKIKKKGIIEICKIAIENHPNNIEVLRQAKNTLGVFSPFNNNININNNSNNINNNNNNDNKKIDNFKNNKLFLSNKLSALKK
jgi:hypothetical protein